jgi:phosphoribosylglycinamide formyltransferase-1
MNIAVLASGNGTNFEAIAKAISCGCIKADLKLLVSDKKDAYARVRAEKFRIKNIFIDPNDFKSRLDFDKALVKLLRKEKTNLVVLAGFMRILTPYFVRAFTGRIINIHPAILPAFRGEHAIERAYKYGCKVTGVTVHFVDEKVDHGPVILQGTVTIKEDMRLREIEKQIHALEHKLYPLAIKLIAEKRIRRTGRYVKIY